MHEAGDGIGFVFQIFGGGAAVVDQEGDGERLIGLAFENGDLLRGAVVGDFEIGLFERADERSAWSFTVARMRTSWTSTRMTGLRHPEPTVRPARQTGDGNATKEAARGAFWSHSPSTQTSPSAKNSFFQMGTRRLRRLMPSSAASKAGRRCGAVVMTATLASPISRVPRRCSMRDAADRELARNLAPDLRHFADGHFFVALIFEAQRFPASGIVTDHALEGYNGAVQSLEEAGFGGAGIDGIAGEDEEMAGGVGDLVEGRATADGGEQGYFVAFGQNSAGAANSWLRAITMLRAIPASGGNRAA